MNFNIQKISWDSNFFKREIGRIIIDAHEELDFDKINSVVTKSNYDLVYVFKSINDFSRKFKSEEYLVDVKVVFQKNVSNLVFDVNEIQAYNNVNIPILEPIYSLALESGVYSRFKSDKRFNESDFARLYKKWVDNSLSGDFADDIFLYIELDEVLGFVTVKYSNEEAVIGLIAVNPKLRGKAIGSKLLQKVEYLAFLRGCNLISVATQLENEQACMFYKRNNYAINHMTNIYHIWN